MAVGKPLVASTRILHPVKVKMRNGELEGAMGDTPIDINLFVFRAARMAAV